jgi:hypothetical protein
MLSQAQTLSVKGAGWKDKGFAKAACLSGEAAARIYRLSEKDLDK